MATSEVPAELSRDEWKSLLEQLDGGHRQFVNVLDTMGNKPITIERFPGLEGKYDGINGRLWEIKSPAVRVTTTEGENGAEFFLVRR